MALATRCPHCHTTFKVAHDQLKLRAGLVRCGHCKEIFNGIEHLLPQESRPAPAAEPRAAGARPHNPVPLPSVKATSPVQAPDAHVAYPASAPASPAGRPDEGRHPEPEATGPAAGEPVDDAADLAAAPVPAPQADEGMSAAPTASAAAADDAAHDHRDAPPVDTAAMPADAARAAVPPEAAEEIDAADAQARADASALPTDTDARASGAAATPVPAEPEPEPKIPDFFDLLFSDKPAAPQRDTARDAAPDEVPAPEPEAGIEEATGTLDTDPLTRMTLMHRADEIDGDAGVSDPVAVPHEDSVDQALDALDERPDRRKPRARRLRNGFLLAQEERSAPSLEEEELRDLAEGVEQHGNTDIAPAAETTATGAAAVDRDEHAARDDGHASEAGEEQATGTGGHDSDLEDIEEPSFLRAARRRERYGRVMGWLTGTGSVLLALLLAGQAIYAFRNPIALRMPQARPALAAACKALGCRIGLPMNIEAITPVEGADLQAVSSSKDVLALSLVLRNRASLPQAWPHIELTLKDADRKPLVRRVFAPAEYLRKPQDLEAGMPPGTEQQIRLTLSSTETAASDFEVGVFYP